MNSEKILRNRCQCKKCGDIIESKYTHDYVRCKCGSIATDGGTEYQRRLFPEMPMEDWIIDMTEYATD